MEKMHMELSNQFVCISWVNFAVLIGFLLLGIFSRKLNNLFLFQFPLSKGDVTRDDSQRWFWLNTALQCWNNVTSIQNIVATMFQPCVVLKSSLRIVSWNITLTLSLSGWMMESFKVALTFKIQRNCATHRVKVKEGNRVGTFRGCSFQTSLVV